MKSFVVLAAVLAVAYAKPGLNLVAGPGLLNTGLGYAGLPVTYTTGLTGAVQYAAAPVQYTTGAVQYAAAPVQYTTGPVTYAAPVTYAVPAVTKTQYHAQDELGQSSHGYAHPGQAAAEVRDAFGNVRGSYAYVDPNGKEVRVNYVADAVNGFRVESNALPVGPSVPETPALIAPEPVQDTPEVAAAKAEHAKAVEAAQAAADAAPEEPAVTQSRKKRGLAYTYGGLTTLAGTPTVLAAAPSYRTVVAGPTVLSAAPALRYAHAPAVYTAGPTVLTTGGLTYAAAPALALRQATLTKVVNTPGHAVTYTVV